jgi:hypothetical protein
MVPLVLAPIGGLIGGLCGGVAAGVNSLVARQRSVETALKLVLMGLTTLAAVTTYLIFAFAILGVMNPATDDQHSNPPIAQGGPNGGQVPPQPKPQLPPPAPGEPGALWDTTVTILPPSQPLPPGTVPEKFAPTDPINFVVTQLRAKLSDGPAAATAGHAVGRLLAVGYADGSTALWDIEKRMSQTPLPGPKFPGPVNRLWIVGDDRYLLAESGGRLRIATLRAPHRSVTVPKGLAGVRVCAFGSAAIVQQGKDGYRTWWLFSDVFDRNLLMPPKGYGTVFDPGDDRLEAPPVTPQALTWIHDTPAALLPDGRVLYWDGQAKVKFVLPHPQPVAAWSVAMPQVGLTSVDRAGNVHIRTDPDFKIRTQFQHGLHLPARLLSDAGGTWTLTADHVGGAKLWLTDNGPAQLVYRGNPGKARDPVIPLAFIDGCFAVGLGRSVELWSVTLLQHESKMN